MVGESAIEPRKLTIQSGNITFKNKFEENQLPEKCHWK